MLDIRRWTDSHPRSIALQAGLGLGAIWTVAAAVEPEILRIYLGYFYLSQIGLFAFLFYRKTDGDVYQMFRPSVLMLAYIGLSVSFGAFLYSSRNVLGGQVLFLITYEGWGNFHYLYFLVSGSFMMIFMISCFTFQRIEMLSGEPDSRKGRILIVWWCTLLLLLALPFEHFIAEVVRAVSAIAILYVVFTSRWRTRWLITLLCVGLTATIAYHDKRAAIFLLLPALFLEFSCQGRVALSARLALSLAALAAFALYLVAGMSIMRGYGSYEPSNFLEALRLVPDYVQSAEAVAMMGNNLEVSYTFFVLHDAIHASSVDEIHPLMFGESYLKALFVGIPESFFGYKPDSILDNFTMFLDSNFRGIGGSYPPTAIGEAFWNFGALGMLVLMPIALALDTTYYWMMSKLGRSGLFGSVAILTVYQYFMLYIRGSGVDLFVAYVIVTMIIAAAVLLPVQFLLPSARRLPRR